MNVGQHENEKHSLYDDGRGLSIRRCRRQPCRAQPLLGTTLSCWRLGVASEPQKLAESYPIQFSSVLLELITIQSGANSNNFSLVLASICTLVPLLSGMLPSV